VNHECTVAGEANNVATANQWRPSLEIMLRRESWQRWRVAVMVREPLRKWTTGADVFRYRQKIDSWTFLWWVSMTKILVEDRTRLRRPLRWTGRLNSFSAGLRIYLLN
jgi:hypothetical protein